MINFRSISSINQQTASLSVPQPSGLQENDLIVYGIARNTTGADTITATDAGWNNLTQLQGTNVNHLVGWKIATSSEPANYTFTAPSSRGLAAVICAYSGVDISAALSASATNVPGGTGGTTSPPSVAIANDSSFHIACIAGNGDFGTITPPSGYTVRGQQFNAQTVGIFLADATKNAADSPTGTQNFTHTSMAGRTLFSLVFKPGSAVVHNPLVHLRRVQVPLGPGFGWGR